MIVPFLNEVRGRILVVDDQMTNIQFLRHLFSQAGKPIIESTCDPRDTFVLCERFRPDIVLIDRNMPYIDGLELLERFNRRYPDRILLPVVMLTADTAPETRLEALRLGASDFLNKPFDPTEVLLRVSGQLDRRALHVQVQRYNEELEDRVRERTRELEEAQVEIVDRLATAAECRDDDTGEHVQRVANLAAAIADEVGMPQDEIELFRLAVRLHDVGKIGVSDTILLKKGRLDPDEMAAMRRHTLEGSQILAGSRFPLLKMAEQIALCHHERWDGEGYPSGLRGEEIPLTARIAAVADVFDALTHARPYKPAWSAEDALSEIANNRGTHFDPAVVDAFLRLCEMRSVTLPGKAELAGSLR